MRSKVLFSRIALFIAALCFPAVVFAYDPEAHGANPDSTHAGAVHEAGEHDKGFDPGHMIMEHVADAHDWHIAGDLHVPLPVIIKSDKGIDVFSSSNFIDHKTHAPKSHTTDKYTYRLVEGKVVVWDDTMQKENENATATLIDFSITKNVASMFVVAIALCLVFLSIAKSYTRAPGKAPRGMQSFFEPIIMFVRDDLAKPSIGPKYEKFMPYLLTAFFFIWFSNMLGLIPILPGGANLTGSISVALVLATLTFIITTINGNGHYWRHIFAMPGVPPWVLIILTPIEILGVVLRPFVLMIRLFANITAGHIIALAFFGLIFIFSKNGESTGTGLGVGVASWLFTTFMFFLELLVAFIQAYVFTLLSAIYFGSAVEEHHGHDHAEDFDGKPNLAH
jgi:F-type H+-transporting ATPase subunit a